MKIGYDRVSTEKQNLELQLDALDKAEVERVYEEKYTGTASQRPELDKLLEHLREGDTLVVYKLDRLGRSTKNLIELADLLETKDVELVSICDNIDTSTAMGKAMFRMLFVLSEMERDLIAERTKAGLEAARSRGRKGGRPKKKAKDIENALKAYDSKEYTVKEIEELTGVTKPTLYRYLKQR